MAKPREIYVVTGTGRDVTGLVSLVTSIISDINGNIVDLEEKVFHDLFSIVLTVDLSGAKVPGQQFINEIQAVARQSGLNVTAEKQRVAHRLRPKRLMRLTLIGADHPGIVSSATFLLANNGINIERAHMISRGKLFAMEMDFDRGAFDGPVGEIEKILAAEMGEIGIRCLFQTGDIYNKSKRLLVFNIGRNMLERKVVEEMLGKAEKTAGKPADIPGALRGLPLETLDRLTGELQLSSEGEDLVHALKMMGFRVGLILDGFDLFLKPMCEHAGIDHIRSNRLEIERGVLTGEIENHCGSESQRRGLIEEIKGAEKVADRDTIIVGDSKPADIGLDDCGIRFVLGRDNLARILSEGAIDKKQIPAILSAFGPL